MSGQMTFSGAPIGSMHNFNSSSDTGGRFGNHLIRNIAANFLVKQHNIRYEYTFMPEMTRLGFTVYNGANIYTHTVGVNESNYFETLNGPPCNIAMEHYYQTKEFMDFLRSRVETGSVGAKGSAVPVPGFAKDVASTCADFRPNIVEENAVFVHVRLGDIADVFDIPFSYYDAAMQRILGQSDKQNGEQSEQPVNQIKGYISSDSIDHPTCTALIQKYDLQPVLGDGVQTVIFASKCKHMVLSQGSFSWMMSFVRWIYRRSAGLPEDTGIVVRSDHSQELPWAGNMLSTFSTVELHYDPYRLVTGERLQYLADAWIGNPEDFAFNPAININTDRHLSQPSQYNKAIVFGYTHHLEWLSRATTIFERPFVLITHNSDMEVANTPYVRAILAAPNLICWYTSNLCFRHPKLRILPIGIANRQWPHGADFMHFTNLHQDHTIIKSNGIYLCVRVETNPGPRTQCVDALKQCGIDCLPIVPSLENIGRMATYRFCVCPPGNGHDTHRLWEALVLKCVPVVVRDAFIDTLLYEHPTLPIVVLDQWTDFRVELLPPYESFDFTPVDDVMNVRCYAERFKQLVKMEK
jgi:hypothetical protein